MEMEQSPLKPMREADPEVLDYFRDVLRVTINVEKLSEEQINQVDKIYNQLDGTYPSIQRKVDWLKKYRKRELNGKSPLKSLYQNPDSLSDIERLSQI